jgi:hypothetical protein
VKKYEDLLELSAQKKGRGSSRAAQKRVWTLWTPLLTLLFVIVGVIGIVLSWIIFFALIADESLLIPLVAVLNITTPSLLWITVFLLTRNKEHVTRNRMRLHSAIGFIISIGIAYVLLIPWAFFVIAFRDVRM